MLRDCCTDIIFVFFVDNKNYVLKHQMQASIYKLILNPALA